MRTLVKLPDNSELVAAETLAEMPAGTTSYQVTDEVASAYLRAAEAVREAVQLLVEVETLIRQQSLVKPD